MRKHTIKLALLSCSSSYLTKLELVPALESIPYWNWFHHGDELELELELQNLKKCPKSNSGTGSGSGITTTLVGSLQSHKTCIQNSRRAHCAVKGRKFSDSIRLMHFPATATDPIRHSLLHRSLSRILPFISIKMAGREEGRRAGRGWR